MRQATQHGSVWSGIIIFVLAAAWPVVTYTLFVKAVLAGGNPESTHEEFLSLLAATGFVLVATPTIIAIIASQTGRSLISVTFGTLATLCLLAVVYVAAAGQSSGVRRETVYNPEPLVCTAPPERHEGVPGC
ncbi:hypothetical protein [Nonomuraea dietziae]|uniref:hypothetical protein n=1 Tax=Nonomuraea dietziae TaxID=65515 RepID=UPI0034382212